MASTLADIMASVRRSVVSVNGITDSGMIFSPKEAPQPMSHRSFAVSVSTRDTGQDRSDARRRMRKQAIVIIRVSHQMATRNEVEGTGTLGGLPEVWRDMENIESAVWGSILGDLGGDARVKPATGTEPRPGATREQVITDITLDIVYTRDSSTVRAA